MDCDKTTELLDDYIDEALSMVQRDAVRAHVDTCTSCRRLLDVTSVLRETLRGLPVKPPPAGFADTVLSNARRVHERGRPALLTGGVIAACLCLLLIAGLVRMDIDRAAGPAAIQMVEMGVLEQRTISLAFNSPSEIMDVTFRLNLPEGIEIHGFPDAQELVWKDALSNGRNVLQLTLLGQKQMSGTLRATIEHAGQRREFSIPLQVREAGAAYLPYQGPVV